MQKFYKVFDLIIASEVKLGQFRPIKKPKGADFDLEVRLGKIERPEDGLKETLYKPFSVANKDVYFLQIDGIAKYEVKGERVITIDKDKDAIWQDVMTFFYDTVFTVAMIKNDVFLFHASAIKGRDGAYLFCAGPGGGKSTLAAFLIKRRKLLIEDDKCFVRWDEKRKEFRIINQIPTLELWRNIVTRWKFNKLMKPFGNVRKGIHKIRFDASNRIAKREVPVKRLYLLTMDNGEDVIEEKPIEGMGKINFMANFTHLYYLITVLGKAAPHFQYIAKVSQHVSTSHIRRSRLTRISTFINHMVDEISK